MKRTAARNHNTIIKLSILAGLAGLGALTTAQGNEPGRPFPEVKIPKHAKGPEIIAQLGSKLPAVARFYETSEAEFRKHVEHDHSIHADEAGMIYYVCEGSVVEAVTVNAELTSFNQASTAEAFKLASVPGAPLTIYLDFDGHTTSGTYWNNKTGGADFTTPAYDTDGNPSSFTSAELSNIVDIWKRVAEDFAPWDVNVTTIDPGAQALIKSSTSDSEYGIRVVIGGSSNDWYGASAGGVAYLGSFTWSSDTPCYVFEAQLGNGNPKYTAEAASHEIGHTFSLYHDGDSSTPYYKGHANWAPIMGVGYYKEVVQWSKGEYANANNTEDDIAKITSKVPLRADLVVDDISTQAVLGLDPVIGIIENETDADIYCFQTDGGTVSLSTEAVNAGNLDIRLGLYDAYGNLIAFNDATGLNASLSKTVSPGTYYVLVEGTSPGDPMTAYNDYGSLGQYRLIGNFATSQNMPPVAVASTSSATEGRADLTIYFSSVGSYDSDGTIARYDWDFGDGSSSTAKNPTHTYTRAGIFTASLVVVDDKGAASSDSVIITVTEPVAPVADASRTTPTSGTAPLTVSLDGTRSSDADGNIVSFSWTTSTGASLSGSQASYTFTNPGTYSVTLQVVDNEGLFDTETITINVSQAAQLAPIYAVDVVVTVDGNEKKGYVAMADLTVVDEKGRPVQSATVLGQFSGAINEAVSTNSGRRGDTSFRSSKFRDNGAVSFTVTDIIIDGYSFVAN